MKDKGWVVYHRNPTNATRVSTSFGYLALCLMGEKRQSKEVVS